MAVRVFCKDPAGLLEKIKASIRNESVKTWIVDSDGDFTSSVPQWNKRAWFRPRIEDDRLLLNILAPVGSRMSREVYAIYHGRFIEMLLAHFDLDFSRATATALPVAGDNIGAETQQSTASG